MCRAVTHKRAVLIDDFIDTYQTARHGRSFPHRAVGRIIHLYLPWVGQILRCHATPWRAVHRAPWEALHDTRLSL